VRQSKLQLNKTVTTGLTHELSEQSVVGEIVSGAQSDDNVRHGRDIYQKAEDKSKTDVASPASPVNHHVVVDGDGVERVGGR